VTLMSLLFRGIGSVLYLACSFLFVSVGFNLFNAGSETMGWFFSITGVVAILGAIFRRLDA
jgi:hypothetical protein